MDKGVNHPWMQATLANPWKHDSDLLTQESNYQEDLQIHIGYYDNNPFHLLQNKSMGNFEQDNADKKETEDADVFDSLEVDSYFNAKRNLSVSHMDTCQMLSRNSYSELHYDPNWRTNLRMNDHFTKNPEIYIEEYQHEEECNQSFTSRRGREVKQRYRYVIDSGPLVLEVPQLSASEADQPYHLHPQDAQRSSVAILSCSKKNVPHSEPKDELHRSTSFSTVKESDNTSSRQLNEIIEKKNISMSPNVTDGVHTSENCHQQVTRHTKQVPIKAQNISKSTSTSPQVIWNKNPERVFAKDFVESKKINFGRNTSGCGSYARVHALKQEMTHKGNKLLQPPASGGSTECGDRFSLQSTRPVATQEKIQQMAISKNLPTTLKINSNLNTSSHLLSLPQKEGQYSLIKLASHLGHPPWNHVQLALPTENKEKDSEQPLCTSPGELNLQINQQNLRSSNDDCQSTTESQALGFYSVLPPIEMPTTENKQVLSPGQSRNRTCLLHRNGYLSQMEKQKMLRDNVSYKVPGLRDKKLYANVKGLGPDYRATEKTKTKQKEITKISTIPLPLAKDPEGINKKDPRKKALEYAKNIAKPPLQSQTKQRKQPPEGFTEHMPCSQGLDVSQLAILELLRKRHEEEKQALAHLRKEHSV